ncbi:MAG: ABC transporter ATP-binding protein [Pseudomonadota bacterium]|jgi:branched-chain amino acid transport system ATP-binding protein|nr:ABC transporter ATP-binding protein [Pseudomonadota bacterium]
MVALLRVENLSKSFGGLAALRDLSFEVEQGSIVGLIGPNGAGKTTAFNLISGTVRPSAGRVWFRDVDITGGPPSRVVGLGLARTFQHTSIYPAASVRDNVYRGAIARLGTSMLDQLRGGARTREGLARIDAQVDEVLELMGLAAHRDSLAGALSYGQQKRLGVAIGLATRPTLLLLDEPAAGLNPEESAEFGRLLRELRGRLGLTMLLVEHHMALVMDLCERIVVLVQGARIAEDTPAAIARDPAVIEAYLGAEEDDHARG